MDPTWWTAFGSIAAAVGSFATFIGIIFAVASLQNASAQLKQSRDVAVEAKAIAQGEFLFIWKSYSKRIQRPSSMAAVCVS